MKFLDAEKIKSIGIPVAVLAAAFAALYYGVIAKMVKDWMIDDNYSHGFLIPPIAAYLIWQKRAELSRPLDSPSNTGLLFLTMGLLVFLVGNLGAELFTMRFSMLVVIWSLVLHMAGWQTGRKTFIPIAYLGFMIPLPAIIWNQIAFPLKLFATALAANAIGAIGIPIFREGNILHLSNTTLEVVDACSGLRSLTSLLALSGAFALISQHSTVKKWILFLSAVPIAILVNIIRLTGTAALAHIYGEKVAQGFLHEFSGIVTFVLAILSLYVVHVLLQKSTKTG
jgi:exosortase